MKDGKLVWIIAGEASGDIYGARLAQRIWELGGGPEKVRVAGMGGPEMAKAGVEIIIDSTELGVVGVVEIVKHLWTFIKLFIGLVRRAGRERPDAVVLIDYPGFNIRFAWQMWLRKIPVVWYISPHVWAWAGWRKPKLAKYCSKMLVIFPFEVDVYAGTGLDVEFVGHPLVEIVNGRRDPSLRRDPDTVLLLPGSRGHEIDTLLDDMLDTAVRLRESRPELKFVVSAPRERIKNLVERRFGDYLAAHPGCDLPLEITCGDTARWLQVAGTGLAASGTITVESALAGLPLVSVYRVKTGTYWIGKVLIRGLKYFTMVNIIADKPVFHEFLQYDVNADVLTPELAAILPGGGRRAEVESQMAEVVEMLSGGAGDPSTTAAKAVLNFVDAGGE